MESDGFHLSGFSPYQNNTKYRREVVFMPNNKDRRCEERKLAEKIFLEKQGNVKLVDIAEELHLPANKIRKWKSLDKWEEHLRPLGKKKRVERSTKEKGNAPSKRGAPKGNKNAVGNNGGAPRRNKNAEKHGFFSKYLPEDSMSIIEDIKDKDYIDILWENIQIAYAAILRAQKIMFVKDKEELTKEIKKIKKKEGETEIEWEFQFSWDRQATFLSAQARAMSELRYLIKQYEEIATEEQMARVAKIKAQTERIKNDDNTDSGDSVDDWIAGVLGTDPEQNE